MTKYSFIFVLLILSVLAASCAIPASSDQNQSSFSIEDALGRQVEFQSLPERIVIGGNGALMIVDALLAFPEGQERLVAYTKTDQGKGNFSEVLLADKDANIIEDRTSIEAIASYQPDVVLLKSYMQDIGNALEEIGIPVVYLDLETLEQYQKDINNLGKLLGNEERAQELLGYYTNIVNSIEQTTQTIVPEEQKSVLFAYYDTKDGAVAVKVPPMEWAQTVMITRAGGIPVWDDIELGAKWTVVNFEQIAAWNPDVIFLTAYFDNVDEIKLSLQNDSQWKELRAVKTGQLIAFPMAFYSWDQPHTRWGLAQQWVAYQLYPETYKNFDFHNEAVNFYRLFYGWDEAKYDEIIQTRLQGDIP